MRRLKANCLCHATARAKRSLRAADFALRAFTLVEVLVVIAIIGVLVTLLLPALSQAKDLTRRVTCLSQTRAVGTAVIAYSLDNATFIPARNAALHQVWAGSSSGQTTLFQIFPAYLGDISNADAVTMTGARKLMICPTRMVPSRYGDNRFTTLSAYGPTSGYSSYSYPGGSTSIKQNTGPTPTQMMNYDVQLSKCDPLHPLIVDSVTLGEGPASISFPWLQQANHYNRAYVGGAGQTFAEGGNAFFADGRGKWIPEGADWVSFGSVAATKWPGTNANGVAALDYYNSYSAASNTNYYIDINHMARRGKLTNVP